MKKGTIISIFALLISIVGLMIALIAYFKRRNCVLCDDLEDDMVEFYDEDCDGCCCDETADDESDIDGEEAVDDADATDSEESTEV